MTVSAKNNVTTIAAFDFDGTLTYHDSLFPFIRMAVGLPRFLWGIIILSPVLSGYAVKIIKNSDAKQAVLKHFFGGLEHSDFQELGHKFATQKLPSMLKPKAMQRLRWHQQQGHQVIIVSASLETYLQPWAEMMQCGQVIGSKIEVVDNHLTGHLNGKNCYGSEKVVRLEKQLGKLNSYYMYAYGDSKGDRELLASADKAFFKIFTDLGDKNK